jgi:hypothetical protein
VRYRWHQLELRTPIRRSTKLAGDHGQIERSTQMKAEASAAHSRRLVRRSLAAGALVVALSLGIGLASAAGASSLEGAPGGGGSLESAAVSALRWAFYAPNGYRWEYGGILVLHDGEVMYNAFPRTLKKVDAVPMDAYKQLNPGDELIGLYHTHPCKSKEYFSQYYSPQDLVSVYYYRVPSFILDECTGKVHEFDPAVDRAKSSGTVVTIALRDGRRRIVHLPSGRIVGNIGDRGPDLSAIEELVGRTTYQTLYR